jgi:agmatinase
MEIPRFAGIRTFMRLPHLRTEQDIDYAIVGVPFDTAMSYRSGARFGPAAIRDISSLIKPYNAHQDVNVADMLSGVDYGDIPVVPGCIEESYARIENGLTPLLRAGVTPICLGGDHSITLGELRAAAGFHGPVALVQCDAHCDTADAYFGMKHTHGTVFRRALEEGLLDADHSIQVGMRGSFYAASDLHESAGLGFEVITGFTMRSIGIEETVRRIISRVAGRPAFLTYDIDIADPAFAPGTGTPESGGLSGAEALELARGLKGIPFVAYDLVEVLPAYDPAQITALLAANLVFEFIALLALRKKERQEGVSV